MIKVDRAIRTRWCKECHLEIPAGTYHIKYQEIAGHGSKNVCPQCAHRLVTEVDTKNGYERRNK